MKTVIFDYGTGQAQALCDTPTDELRSVLKGWETRLMSEGTMDVQVELKKRQLTLESLCGPMGKGFVWCRDGL